MQNAICTSVTFILESYFDMTLFWQCCIICDVFICAHLQVVFVLDPNIFSVPSWEHSLCCSRLPRSCCRKTSIAKVKWSSLLLSQWTVKGPPGSSSSTALREEMEGSRGMSATKNLGKQYNKTIRKRRRITEMGYAKAYFKHTNTILQHFSAWRLNKSTGLCPDSGQINLSHKNTNYS